MKAEKAVGLVFLIIGLMFAIVGATKLIYPLSETDERIYTTARIVRIDERKTKDPEFPTQYTAYVELEVDGEKVIAKLNTYNSSFKVDKQIDIYYFENDINMAYQKNSEIVFVFIVLGGVMFAVLGSILAFRKRHTA